MTNMLEPRNLGDILGETFRAYGRNFLRLVAIVAIVEVILGILGYPLTLPAIAIGGETASLVPFVLLMIILVVCSIVGYAMMEGALIYAISQQSLEQTINIRRAYSFAWKRLGAMIGAEILAVLALIGMAITIIGIPVAIYFGVRWTFIWQAALLQGAGPKDALSRSSDVVEGNWWRVVGILFVLGVITWLATFILGFIPIVGEIIGAILVTPITITCATLLYYDLRVRKEGYSLEALAQELQVKTSSDVA